jgi:hypothetical protein
MAKHAKQERQRLVKLGARAEAQIADLQRQLADKDTAASELIEHWRTKYEKELRCAQVLGDGLSEANIKLERRVRELKAERDAAIERGVETWDFAKQMRVERDAWTRWCLAAERDLISRAEAAKEIMGISMELAEWCEGVDHDPLAEAQEGRDD